MSDPRQNIPDLVCIPPDCYERFLACHLPHQRSLASQGIGMAGISRLIPPYAIGRRDPSHHLLIATVTGRGRLRTPQGEHQLGVGELLLAPAHQPHHYWAEGEWQIIWLHLTDHVRWAAMRAMPLQVRPVHVIRSGIWVMEQLLEEAGRGAADERTLICLTDLLVCYLERELVPSLLPLPSPVAEELRALWERVNAQLQYPWRIEELADLLGCSPSQLYRMTAAYDGTTPMERVAQLRIARARALLSHTDYSHDQIATLVGYATPFAFSRAFRRLTGQSPRAFRQGGLE
jgi:AraC-like DNA-binding protein